MDTEDYQQHISKRFNEDLAGVTTQLMRMGGLAQQMVDESIKALIEADAELAAQVVNNDHLVDKLEMSIDEKCLLIIARRQPAASDLRLVLTVTKAITDLERVGDEASKIARQAISLTRSGASSRGFVEIRHIGNRVSQMLAQALDAFARLDMNLALQVVETDKVVDMEYATALREMITFMISVHHICQAQPLQIVSCRLELQWAQLQQCQHLADRSVGNIRSCGVVVLSAFQCYTITAFGPHIFGGAYAITCVR